MAEENKDWILCSFTKIAPSFEKIEEHLAEKGVVITPNDYINACKQNNLQPDIHPIFIKIDESSVTLEDINIVLEDIGDAVKERVLRKFRKSPGKSHTTHSGHQRLGGTTMAGRVTPKHKRSGHTQSHGRGKHAHDRSTKKQRRSAGNVNESGQPDGSPESNVDTK